MPSTAWISIVASSVVAITLACVNSTYAQSSSTTVFHQIDGRLHTRNGKAASNIHIRLLRLAGMRPVGDTFSRSRGEFEFNYVLEGEYVIETFETPELDATTTRFEVRPPSRERSVVFHVEIDIPFKPAPLKQPPGVVAADIDQLIPKEALKHHRAATKALADSKPVQAVENLHRAIKAFPDYYAARLDLGRELRRQKRFKEAEDILAPLRQIAPKRVEPLIEHALVLLDLERRTEAAKELHTALQIEELNWAAHFYLGWALLEEEPEAAESHFKRAIEIDESKAARAHLALARLADAKGLRQLAIRHLERYLVLLPNGSEAQITRGLIERLRK